MFTAVWHGCYQGSFTPAGSGRMFQFDPRLFQGQKDWTVLINMAENSLRRSAVMVNLCDKAQREYRFWTKHRSFVTRQHICESRGQTCNVELCYKVYFFFNLCQRGYFFEAVIFFVCLSAGFEKNCIMKVGEGPRKNTTFLNRSDTQIQGDLL